MTVLELLKLMGSLSFGEQNVTETENALFLQYLNLAHYELYAETASFNEGLSVSETIQKQQDQGSVDLSRNPHVMSVVCLPSLLLTLPQVSLQDALQDDPTLKKPGNPRGYILQHKTLTLVPYQAAPLSVLVWYIPEVSPLLQTTPENEIPYPRVYHQLLAEGALYYLFQDQSGFKNPQKMMEANRRWNLGKQRLLGYLRGLNSIDLSTFSSV